MLCPYCLGNVEPKTRQEGRVTQFVCPGCEQPLPRDFVESKAPNTTIGLIGFSGHGKTVYIHYLFYVLSHLKNEWPDYYYTSLDDHTDRIVYEQVPRLRKESVLPDSTPANFPLPALLLHHNFPGHGDRFVTVYDTAGEVFEQTQTITDQGRYVAHADTVLFLVSLADLGENWGDRLELLLQKYVRAAHDHLRVELKQRQRLVVVFTKADLLLGSDAEKPLPKELAEYLQAGSCEAYRELPGSKVRELWGISRRIEEWLGGSGCRAFVNMARDSFKEVAFTLVSATGSAPVGQKLATRLEPRDPKRVLDPLLWGLGRMADTPFAINSRVFGEVRVPRECSLEEATHATLPGRTIVQLEPGLHELSGPAEISHSLSLKAARIAQVAGGSIRFSGEGQSTFKNIEFLSTVTIASGTVDIRSCRFQNGLMLVGNARARLAWCSFTGGKGLEIRESAATMSVGCRFANNSRGASIFEGGLGWFIGCIFSGNTWSGLGAYESSRFRAICNIFYRNKYWIVSNYNGFRLANVGWGGEPWG